MTLPFLVEPSAVYHLKAKHYLSSHQLAEFRRCPLLYHRRQLGLLPDSDSPAYLVGRAAHTLILEGRTVFDETYAVGGPVNAKTGKPFGTATKAYTDWADMQARPVLGDSQLELCLRMHDSVRAHRSAREFLVEGTAEGVLRGTLCGEHAQARLDWYAPVHGIVDLKTCEDLQWFESDARRFGYAHQLAFYRDMVHAVSGARVPVHLLAIEKREPFRCGVWLVPAHILDRASADNARAIAALRACRSSAAWPTGYEDIRVFCAD